MRQCQEKEYHILRDCVCTDKDNQRVIIDYITIVKDTVQNE